MRPLFAGSLVLGLMLVFAPAARAQECVSCYSSKCLDYATFLQKCEPPASPGAKLKKGAPSLPACTLLRERSPSTHNRCCFPGQRFDGGLCAGTPTACPKGFAPADGFCHVTDAAYVFGAPPIPGSTIHFFGIGAVLEADDHRLIVTGTLPGSPAARSGVRENDRIVRVDDLPTEGMTLEDVVAYIRGVQGVPVMLRLARADGSTVDLAIPREPIESKVPEKQAESPPTR